MTSSCEDRIYATHKYKEHEPGSISRTIFPSRTISLCSRPSCSGVVAMWFTTCRTTTVLSWDIQNIIAILYPTLALHWNKISIELQLLWKKICAKWSPDPHSSCRYHRAWQWQANFEYSTKHSVTRESLLWRHNGCNGISNHQLNDCLHNRIFRRRSKKTSSAASLAFLREINRWPVNSPHKRPVKQKMIPFDIVIRMIQVFDYLKWNTMITSSNGNIFRVTGHLCGEFTGHHKGQWRKALMFSLICVWINGWVNNR